MTRADLTRHLARLERLREDIEEAESTAEERRLGAEYSRIWKAIAPYCNGRLRCSDDPPGRT